MINSQGQKGGDGSTNIQAQTLTVQVGIDEKRAREICHEINLQLRNQYTQDALGAANSRVAEFENRLMPKMARVEGALEAFADPSFQLLIIQAQKAAACTEREADYDLLAELMIHRFQKGESRVERAGINRAVEIVDQISDEALLGLTITHAVSSFYPLSGNLHQGLDTLDSLFGKIFYGKLPLDQEWLDHLDILDAVRLNSMSKFKPITQYYSENLSGYWGGIEKNSENHHKANEILASAGVPAEVLIEHALNKDFVRIQIRNIEAISKLFLTRNIDRGGEIIAISDPLSEEQMQALRDVYGLYSQDTTVTQNNINLFINEWDKRVNLKALREWWDNIPISFTVTSVGKVLAHANAQRCDKNLPPLN